MVKKKVVYTEREVFEVLGLRHFHSIRQLDAFQDMLRLIATSRTSIYHYNKNQEWLLVKKRLNFVIEIIWELEGRLDENARPNSL